MFSAFGGREKRVNGLGTNELIYKTETNSDTQNGLVVAKGGWDGWGVWGWEMSTIPFRMAKQ